MSSFANTIDTMRCVVGFGSARSRVSDIGRVSYSGAAARVAGNEVHDVLHRRTWQKHTTDAELVQFRDIDVRDDAADDDEHVVHLVLAQQVDDARADVHVSARK